MTDRVFLFLDEQFFNIQKFKPDSLLVILETSILYLIHQKVDLIVIIAFTTNFPFLAKIYLINLIKQLLLITKNFYFYCYFFLYFNSNSYFSLEFYSSYYPYYIKILYIKLFLSSVFILNYRKLLKARFYILVYKFLL